MMNFEYWAHVSNIAFVLGCLREAEQDGTLSVGIAPEAGAVIELGSTLSLAQQLERMFRGLPWARERAEESACIEHIQEKS
jgi:hypothetical protein